MNNQISCHIVLCAYVYISTCTYRLSYDPPRWMCHCEMSHGAVAVLYSWHAISDGYNYEQYRE